MIKTGGHDAKFIFPLCIRYSLSQRRTLKYANAPQNIIRVRDLQNDKVYSGKIIADSPEGKLLFPDDYDKEAWSTEQAAIAEA